jgi:hypothetical protein
MRRATAACDCGVRRIVYLGGLHPDGPLSAHLESRREVGEILLCSGVPTAVLQAAVVLGSGSASFEMLRYLTERLPVMVTPRWVGTRIQPRRAALPDRRRSPARGVNRTFDIGGPEVLTYREMMARYAAVAELPARRVLPVPVLTPRLSAHWVNVVTPVPRAIAVPLIDSLVHEVVCREQDILAYLPDPPAGRIGYDRAVALALTKISTGDVETRWSDAADPLPSDPQWAGGTVYVDDRERSCAADPETLWSVVTGIGGGRGWYSLVPGRAWLELTVRPAADAGSRYRQRAVFLPRGLAGHLYWWAVAPFHGLVFGGMVRNIARAAERGTDS